MKLNLTVPQVKRLIDVLGKEVEPVQNSEDIQYFLDDDAWLLKHLKLQVTAEESEQALSNDLDSIPF